MIKENLLKRGQRGSSYTNIRNTGITFPGIWPGIVVNNVDTLVGDGLSRKGRVQVRVPQVHGGVTSIQKIIDKDLPWALPCFPFADADSGFLAVPQIGSGVWVFFQQGDPRHPVWVGCSYSIFENVSDFVTGHAPDPRKYVFKSPLQNKIVLSDAPPVPQIQIASPGDLIEEIGRDQITTVVANQTVTANIASLTAILDRNVSAGRNLTYAAVSGFSLAAATAAFSITGSLLLTGASASLLALSVIIGQVATAQRLMNSLFLGLYNSHTHVAPGGGGPTSPPAVLAVDGVHTTINTTAS